MYIHIYTYIYIYIVYTHQPPGLGHCPNANHTRTYCQGHIVADLQIKLGNVPSPRKKTCRVLSWLYHTGHEGIMYIYVHVSGNRIPHAISCFSKITVPQCFINSITTIFLHNLLLIETIYGHVLAIYDFLCQILWEIQFVAPWLPILLPYFSNAA